MTSVYLALGSCNKTYKTNSGLTRHTDKVHSNGTLAKQKATRPNLPELFKEVQKEISSNSCYLIHITVKISSCILFMVVDIMVSEISSIYTKLGQSGDAGKYYESYHGKVVTNSLN